MPDNAATLPARRNMQKLTDEQSKKADEIEESIRARVRERRLNLVCFFQDFDKCRRGHVSKSQLHRVMAALAVEVDEESVSALCKRYCDLGNHIDFDYQDFCAVCDPPADREKE